MSFLTSFFFWSVLELSSNLQIFLLSLQLFCHPSFPHAQAIAISALSQTHLSSCLSHHELFHYLCSLYCLSMNHTFATFIFFLVIQHLAPLHKAFLTQLLCKLSLTQLLCQLSLIFSDRTCIHITLCYILKFILSRSYSCSDSFLLSSSRAKDISQIRKLCYFFYYITYLVTHFQKNQSIASRTKFFAHKIHCLNEK